MVEPTSSHCPLDNGILFSNPYLYTKQNSRYGIYRNEGTDSLACGRATVIRKWEDGFVYMLFPSGNNIEVRLGRALADSAHSRCILFSNPYLYTKQNSRYRKVSAVLWWGRTDSNHRSETQQIYSLSPLATRELPHIRFCSGAGRRTRTPDLLITNQLLYQLSYTGGSTEHGYYTTVRKKVKHFFHFFQKILPM